jgi:hypothetical protein
MKNIILYSSFILLFLIFLISSFLIRPDLILPDDAGFISMDVPVDLVLLIDESGSMKKNDPNRLRVDAASLFIELNQILTENNRISIAGFGEVTNIYIEPTNVAMNKQGILEAARSIKSDQQYTDMKKALKEIKLMLDGRVRKNNAVVILLTDGDLGIDDIPIPGHITEDNSGSGIKPNPPSRGISEGVDADERQEGQEEPPEAGIDREEKLYEYLEEYKQELYELCYEYAGEGIRIFPIAFTPEANACILEEISNITGSRMWVSQNAADVRNVYLDIFKYITNVFISVNAQKEQGVFEGSLELADYIRKAAVISVANAYTDVPSITLQPPPPGTGQAIEDIKSKAYDIKAIDKPGSGSWKYSIEGDLVLALDLADIELIEPLDAVYFDDSEIPVMIQILNADTKGEDALYADFDIRCSIRDPGGREHEGIALLDNGKGIDRAAGDGIFSYGFDGVGSPGEYTIEFFIYHIPTGASSLKKKVFTVTDYQPVKKILYLTIENNIISTTPVVIHANLEDYSQGVFRYTMTCPSGEEIKGELLDNGNPLNSDDMSGDGVYSNIVEGLSEMGIYSIEAEADYKSIAGYDITQPVSAEIGKYVDIEMVSINDKADTGPMTVNGIIRINSILDSPVSVEAGISDLPNSPLEKVVLDQTIVQAGKEQDINMTIGLLDTLEEGTHTGAVSIIVDGAHAKVIDISFSTSKDVFHFSLKNLIGLILVILSLVPLIFILYTTVSARKPGAVLSRSRMIAGAALFAAFFITGLILVFI